MAASSDLCAPSIAEEHQAARYRSESMKNTRQASVLSSIPKEGVAGVEVVEPARSALDLRVAKSVDEIETLRDTWTSWHRHPNSDINYYLSSLQTIPGTRRPHVMAVYRRGALDCLLVGKLQQRLSSISAAGVPLPPARAFPLHD